MLDRAEQAAEEIRRTARASGPVDPWAIAKFYDFEICVDAKLRPRGFTCPGTPEQPGARVIWLRGGERDTRTAASLSHELGHWFVYDQHRGDLTERACDRFGAALLLPAAEFTASARELDCDPLALAKVWRFSSVEAITRRLGEVVPGVLSAKWVEFAAHWRAPRCPRAGLARLELEALGDAYLRPRGHGVAEGRAGRARVWRMSAGPKRALAVMQAA